MGFMFFPDMLMAAKEMARVLKPGGRIAASYWWVAEKNPQAKLPDEFSQTHLKNSENAIPHFRFPDQNGHMISLQDPAFRNKVVIIQILGSWCPNCMDETAFLSDYYTKNRQRGVEVIGLAYEYTTDRERSLKSLQKFRDRYHVEYPMLITGVAVRPRPAGLRPIT